MSDPISESESLSQKALGGIFWSILEKYGGKVIQFGAALFLLRLLSPEDYGLIAMIAVFFALGNVMIESGFSQALIREKTITDADKSTTFYVNLIMAISMYALLWVAAPWISIFFDEPELTDLSRYTGLTMIFFAITIIQRAHFIHKINFRTQAYINLIGATISSMVAVILAYQGFGVWALATQMILLSLVNSALYWVVHPWLPKNFINKESFKKLFGFGSNLMISGVLNITFIHIYKIIIGKLYSSTLLGFYDQALNLKNVVSESFISSMAKVFYPTLSKVKEDQERLKAAYIKIMKATSYVIFPTMAGLGLVAKPFLLTIAGDQWVGAIPILQILVFSGAIYHLHLLNLDILKILNRTDLILRLEIYKKIGVIAAIIIGLQFGFYGLVIAQVISSYVSLYINMTYTATLLQYTRWQQFVDNFSGFLISVPMILVVFAFDFVEIDLIPLKLFVLVSIGIVVYVGTSLLLKPQSFKDLVYIFSPRIPFLRKVKL